METGWVLWRMSCTRRRCEEASLIAFPTQLPTYVLDLWKSGQGNLSCSAVAGEFSASSQTALTLIVYELSQVCSGVRNASHEYDIHIFAILLRALYGELNYRGKFWHLGEYVSKRYCLMAHFREKEILTRINPDFKKQWKVRAVCFWSNQLTLSFGRYT